MKTYRDQGLRLGSRGYEDLARAGVPLMTGALLPSWKDRTVYSVISSG